MTFQSLTKNSKVLISGATGFVGARVLNSFPNQDRIVVIGRTKPKHVSDSNFISCDFSQPIEVSVEELEGVETVIHCAGRAHVLKEESLNPEREYRTVNVAASLSLAKIASQAGAKRFIFISSSKVHGDFSPYSKAFHSGSNLNPKDHFSKSKAEAEKRLRDFCIHKKMDLVIIRPTLVYGENVKANFLSLLKLADTYLPLPFGCVNNSRGMVYVGNLADLIATCSSHANAANRILLVSDGTDLSLSQLIALLRKYMGRSKLLIPVPVFILTNLARLFGKKKLAYNLFKDFRVDNSELKRHLDWTPPFDVEESLKLTVTSYLKNKGGIYD